VGISSCASPRVPAAAATRVREVEAHDSSMSLSVVTAYGLCPLKKLCGRGRGFYTFLVERAGRTAESSVSCRSCPDLFRLRRMHRAIGSGVRTPHHTRPRAKAVNSKRRQHPPPAHRSRSARIQGHAAGLRCCEARRAVSLSAVSPSHRVAVRVSDGDCNLASLGSQVRWCAYKAVSGTKRSSKMQVPTAQNEKPKAKRATPTETMATPHKTQDETREI
jgi:hypothetical protein